jgi:hypothetical protein
MSMSAGLSVFVLKPAAAIVRRYGEQFRVPPRRRQPRATVKALENVSKALSCASRSA